MPKAPLRRRASTAAAPGRSSNVVSRYRDFVIRARRRDLKTIELRVESSPAGTSRALTVEFGDDEAIAIRDAFRGTGESGSLVYGSSPDRRAERRRSAPQGQMLITQDEATGLGKRLANVLFPAGVFRLLAESIARCVKHEGGGVRIRLALDASLIDLPWEYVSRADRLDATGLSGFLLLDPRISMVRMPADETIEISPIRGRERLAFVGTLWEGGIDGWEVRPEFERLRAALKPVSAFITPKFATAMDDEAFGLHLGTAAAIFQYAGHCDFGSTGRPFIIRELDTGATLATIPKVYIDDLAERLHGSPVRLCVMTACNSGFWPAVEPLLRVGIPALIGINGLVASISTIEFCTKLYESLAVGLSLDEAIGRARVHVMRWGARHGLFDWGLYMTYMPSAEAVLFPRASSAAVLKKQTQVRRDHSKAIDASLTHARTLDGINFGEIMSELTRRRVLILGRFTARRLDVLKAIQAELAHHPNGYVPELFTFRKPDDRDLVEAIIGFAALSRFVIADLSEPRSVQSELEAIVKQFQSVPVVPLINQSGREYATFSSLSRRPNVVQPTVRYRNVDDLKAKIDRTVIPEAEEKLKSLRPG